MLIDGKNRFELGLGSFRLTKMRSFFPGNGHQDRTMKISIKPSREVEMAEELPYLENLGNVT